MFEVLATEGISHEVRIGQELRTTNVLLLEDLYLDMTVILVQLLLGLDGARRHGRIARDVSVCVRKNAKSEEKAAKAYQTASWRGVVMFLKVSHLRGLWDLEPWKVLARGYTA